MAKDKVKKSKKLVAPKKHKKEYWDFIEVQHYLEKKHKKNFRDYAGMFGRKSGEYVPYQDFWHWICDNNDQMTNGSFIRLPDFDYHMNSDTTEPWKKEIMQYFYDFLGDEYHDEMWVSW